ncbi:hypothetical protein GFM72_21160 [Salmonella enterica]|nr:hypothetical protein [Salmonella enterica]
MKLKSVLFVALMVASAGAMAQVRNIYSVGFNQSFVKVGESSTAQGESAIVLNVPGYGDKTFAPVNDGQWNTGKPGKRLFYRDWVATGSEWLTLRTWEHEENQEVDISLEKGNKPFLNYLAFYQ